MYIDHIFMKACRVFSKQVKMFFFHSCGDLVTSFFPDQRVNMYFILDSADHHCCGNFIGQFQGIGGNITQEI